MATGTAPADAALPRGLLLNEAWRSLGASVGPLSNADGRPLARTVRRVIDPLVVRPTLNPHLRGPFVAAEHAEELRRAIVTAGPTLAATAAWFSVVKAARRAAAITEGHPQDLYFQRCFELATTEGPPGPEAAEVARALVQEMHTSGTRLTVSTLRQVVDDPVTSAHLNGLLASSWASAHVESDDAPADGTTTPPVARPPGESSVRQFLDTCGDEPDLDLFTDLLTADTGRRAAAMLDEPGAARELGFTVRRTVPTPVLGRQASKNQLPLPFDRSIVERIFAGLTAAFHLRSTTPAAQLVEEEVLRSAQPWQLSGEEERLLVVLGHELSTVLAPRRSQPPARTLSVAHRRLRARWEREASVHRALRLPAVAAVPEERRADVLGMRQAYLRRLWVRAHGRELRGEPLTVDQVWDLLDGVLRSVLLDHRDKVGRARSLAERQAA